MDDIKYQMIGIDRPELMKKSFRFKLLIMFKLQRIWIIRYRMIGINHI